LDFIEKPLETETFLRKVKSLMKRNPVLDFMKDKPLTKNEVRILRLVIEGKSSKEISGLFHRSIRTIEVHRASIMHKLGVDNLVDLVKRAAVMGLIDLIDNQKSE
jgi:DNA-binding CsgD family transcriptional regulator